MPNVVIFDPVARGSAAPQRPGESLFDFLNRCSATFFDPARGLLETWLTGVPAEHHSDLLGRLRRDDETFESALWELYLHQLITGSGLSVDIHPEVPGTPHRPDFLVRDVEPYYLEAVSVGDKATSKSRQKRLDRVEAVLNELRADRVKLSYSWEGAGEKSLSTKRLKVKLLPCVDAIDPEDLADRFARRASLPRLKYKDGDWVLHFTAYPAGRPGGRLIGITGAERAGGVNNESGLASVLAKNSKRYGKELDHPLVIAALSNTEIPTKPFEIRNVLYGEQYISPLSVERHEDLYSDGHWRTRSGWRRSHNPHVVAATGLSLSTLALTAPRTWSTVEPDVDLLPDLTWSEPVDVCGPEPSEATRAPNLEALGITDDWFRGDPDFDLS